jgi:ergothioneine biosynthesis protein EgtB
MIDKSGLDRAFEDAARHTWSVLADLTPEQWKVPYHPGINPPLWEYAHIAWFAEWWVLREARWNARGEMETARPSMLAGADGWFDSGRVAHKTRWRLDLPPLSEIRDYVRAVRDAVRVQLAAAEDTGAALYFHRLALFHEDMHGEALIYMRQTLDYPPHAPLQPPAEEQAMGEVVVDGTAWSIGSPQGPGFVFDNEKWAHAVDLAPFRIDRQCVSHRAFAEFVEAGGYRDERFWSEEGRAWLRSSELEQPARWRKAAQGFQRCWFGQWEPLPLDSPVCHVNAFEAEAYCRWVGRRLPTEAEWELAASEGLILWGGSVWEWVADRFAPYPGFAPDPYRDYSMPWFHTHRSVRGGSFATRRRMHHARYRNFYLPHRSDLFIGFRTCAQT